MFRHKNCSYYTGTSDNAITKYVHIHVRISFMISSSRLYRSACQKKSCKMMGGIFYFIYLFVLLLVNSSASSVVPTCSAACLQLAALLAFSHGVVCIPTMSVNNI